jgi:hypothetical protein
MMVWMRGGTSAWRETKARREKKGESLRAKRKLSVSFLSSLSTPSFHSD